jgi:hypothetical protein
MTAIAGPACVPNYELAWNGAFESVVRARMSGDIDIGGVIVPSALRAVRARRAQAPPRISTTTPTPSTFSRAS